MIARHAYITRMAAKDFSMVRRLSVALAAILALSNPVHSQTLGSAELGGSLLKSSGSFLSGFSGAYLAGRHAAAQSDVDEAGAYFSKALARDPGNAGLMEQTVIYQTAAGRVKAAIPIARHLAEIDPDHRMANLILTVDEFASGRIAEAKMRLDSMPEAFHPLVGALLAAWAAQGVGEPAETLSTLDDRAIFRIFGGYHKGLIAALNNDLDAADEAFQTAIRELRAPTGRMAHAYGAVLRMKGDNEGARALYDAAIGVSVGDAMLEAEIAALEADQPATPLVSTSQEGAAEALFGLASALSQGQEAEARLSLFYTRLAEYLHPGLADAALLSAEILEGQKQYGLAVIAYESIKSDSPLSRSAEIGRAEALYRLEENDKAVEALTTLARREPDAVDVHLALGDLMRRLERFSEGAVAYDRSIKLMAAQGRENWVLFYERGICYERSGQWDLAIADFRKSLELEPDQPLVLNYLGYSWLDRGENFEEALEMVRKAVAQRPEDGYIIDSLGWGYYLTGDYENAVLELERAVEFRPVDPVINDHLGDALWKVGRQLEAEFQWKRALSFEPDDDDLHRIIRKLKVGLDVVLEEEAAKSDDPSASVKDDG